jgi:hypothetical protein
MEILTVVRKGENTMSKDSKNIGWKWIIVTIVIGALVFLLSPNAPLGRFWGHPAQEHTPQGIQRVFFILLNVIQSLAFGLGFTFLLFGWQHIKEILPGNKNLSLAVYLAMAWSLISWWPHTSLHQIVGMENITNLLAVEYVFHVTVILGGVIMLYFVLTKIKQNQV